MGRHSLPPAGGYAGHRQSLPTFSVREVNLAAAPCRWRRLRAPACAPPHHQPGPPLRRLGWLCSFFFLALFSLGCGYLGFLFTRLGLAVPAAVAMDEIGAAAMATLGVRLVYLCVYTTIFVGGQGGVQLPRHDKAGPAHLC